MRFFKRIFNFIFSTADVRVKKYIRVICFCKQRGYFAIGLIVIRRLQRNYGVFISYSADFDESLILRHPVGVVIGDGVKIGKNVIIFQNVTLGRSDTFISAYPDVGDNTIIYSGAVVIGDVTIGKNCVIGANAVVTRDVPDNSIAVGVPARIVLR